MYRCRDFEKNMPAYADQNYAPRSHMIDLNVKKKNRRVKRLISLHIEKKKDKMNSREHQYS